MNGFNSLLVYILIDALFITVKTAYKLIMIEYNYIYIIYFRNV